MQGLSARERALCPLPPSATCAAPPSRPALSLRLVLQGQSQWGAFACVKRWGDGVMGGRERRALGGCEGQREGKGGQGALSQCGAKIKRAALGARHPTHAHAREGAGGVVQAGSAQAAPPSGSSRPGLPAACVRSPLLPPAVLHLSRRQKQEGICVSKLHCGPATVQHTPPHMARQR